MPITVTITRAERQIVAGIPEYISIETNIPANIFYTIDGSTPDEFSDIYISPIKLPTDQGSVELKVFATNGIESSTIITDIFEPSFIAQRRPRDRVFGNQLNYGGSFPFSSAPDPLINGEYETAGGVNVDIHDGPQIPDGYNGMGLNIPSNYTNKPVFSYDLIFSETNAIGETGRGIGTLPAYVVQVRDTINEKQESSNTSSPFFNPKAMVIYQDERQPQYDPDITLVNRPYFSLENSDRARDGMLKQTSEAQTFTGSALRTFFNPSDNTIQYSYYDSVANRWIISKVPFTPKNENIGNYGSVVFPSSSNPGAKYVFKWMPFQARKLF